MRNTMLSQVLALVCASFSKASMEYEQPSRPRCCAVN